MNNKPYNLLCDTTSPVSITKLPLYVYKVVNDTVQVTELPYILVG